MLRSPILTLTSWRTRSVAVAVRAMTGTASKLYLPYRKVRHVRRACLIRKVWHVRRACLIRKEGHMGRTYHIKNVACEARLPY